MPSKPLWFVLPIIAIALAVVAGLWQLWPEGDVAGTAATYLNPDAAVDGRNDQWPQVATDGEGHWIAVWEASDTMGGQPWGADTDILFASSADDGQTWSQPQALNANAGTDAAIANDLKPQIAYGQKDKAWVVVWLSPSPSDPLSWDVSLTHCANQFGQTGTAPCTWSAPQTIFGQTAGQPEVVTAPHLATDGQGNWLVVWQGSDDLQDTIQGTKNIHAKFSADLKTWQSPITKNIGTTGPALINVVNHTACKDCKLGNATTPNAAFGNGTWAVAWVSTRPSTGPSIGPDTLGYDDDILFATSSDGINWGSAQRLNPNAEQDHALPVYAGPNPQYMPVDSTPKLATNGQGIWVAVWQSQTHEIDGQTTGHDWDIAFAYSLDNAVTWQGPHPVADYAVTDKNNDINPHVAALGTGNWGVVWQSPHDRDGKTGLDLDVYFALITAKGTGPERRLPVAELVVFGDTKAISPEAETDDDTVVDWQPFLASKGVDTWLAVWSSMNDLTKTASSDFDILYANVSLPKH